MKFTAWLVKNLISVALAAALVVTVTASYFWVQNQTQFKSAQVEALTAKYEKTSIEHQDFRKKYENLVADRNNILAQTKFLLEDRSKINDLKAANETLKKELETLTGQKQALHEDSRKIRKEKEDADAELSEWTKKHEALFAEHKALLQDNDALGAALAQKMKNSPEYRKLNADHQKGRQENEGLKKKTRDLETQIKKMMSEYRKIQQRNLKLARQSEVYSQNLKKSRADNASLIESNRSLQSVVQNMPNRFKNLAGENKKLVKETSQMHYNLGVFYSTKRDFTIAIKEFERAVAIDSNNANAHYNLGYIFSEQYEQHDRAMTHFKRYLELAPLSKQSEAVRSYMLVRQSYGDKSMV